MNQLNKMDKIITLLKNNDKRDCTDLEWITEFYKWLQGEKSETLTWGFKPRLADKKAFEIIWYLQEQFSLFPDTIERCDICGDLFDRTNDGIYWESKKKFYCGGCQYLVPENYDRGK